MEIFNMNLMILLCYLMYIGLFGLVILIKDYEKKIKLEKIKSSDFLPDDEISHLKQIFLLLFGLLSIIGLIFSFIIKDNVNYFELAVLNIIFTTIAIIYLAEKSYTKLILSVLIIPSTSIIWLLFNKDLPNFFLMIQCIGNLITGLYFIYKFFKYTKNNKLGLTVIIFALILSSSLATTSIGENVSLIDSMVMVSNAFTSNGYTILGHTYIGKLNSITLVWFGYLLSGVGTATLTAAIILKRMKHKMNILYKQNEDLSKEIKELKELIKKE